MKKTLGALLCAAALLASLCVPALAAEPAPSPAEDFDALLDTAPQGDIMPIAGGDFAIPDPQGAFSLVVDGEYVTFSDALPQGRDNRSFLPFRTTVEALGFDPESVTWDADTGTVTARKDDMLLSLTIGEKSISILDLGGGAEAGDGGEKTIETDVAPYVDPATWRTYVPVGLIARAMDGYKVEWIGYSKTVVIENVAAALAANTETYELMDQYMAYARKYAQGNWKQDGKYGLELSLSAVGIPQMDHDSDFDSSDKLDFAFTADGAYDALVSDGTGLQFATDLTMDLSAGINGADISELLKEYLAQSDTGLPTFPMTVDLGMRGDMEKGTFYLRSEALAKLLAGEAGEAAPDAWYKLDMAELWDGIYGSLVGVDWATLLEVSQAQSEKSFQEVLESVIWSMPASPYNTAAQNLAQLNALFGDSAFVKQGSTYINDLGNTLFGDMGQDVDAAMKLVLYTSGGKVDGLGLEMSVSDSTSGGSGGMEITLDLSAEQRNNRTQMDLGFRFGLQDEEGSCFIISLSMNLDGTMASSRTAAETEPPAGAQVVDLAGLMTSPVPDMGVIGGADGPTGILTTP